VLFRTPLSTCIPELPSRFALYALVCLLCLLLFSNGFFCQADEKAAAAAKVEADQLAKKNAKAAKDAGKAPAAAKGGKKEEEKE
jgi:hypothetical protein